MLAERQAVCSAASPLAHPLFYANPLMGGGSSKIAAEVAIATATANARLDAVVEKKDAEIKRLERELILAEKPVKEIQAADAAARAARNQADAEAAMARAAADAAAREVIANIRAGEAAAHAAREQAETEAANARSVAEKAVATRDAEVAASRAAAEEACAQLEAEAAEARAAADAAARAAAVARVAEQEQALAIRMGQSERVHRALELVQRKTRRDSPRIKFYFVLADKLRGSKATTLPALQSLLANPETRDWVVEIEMNFDDACRGKYVDEFLTVSHRWLTEGAADPRRAPPDPKGKQLAAIKEHLAVRPMVKYVWLDWFCMWQGGKDGERDINVDERAEFGWCALHLPQLLTLNRVMSARFSTHAASGC